MHFTILSTSEFEKYNFQQSKIDTASRATLFTPGKCKTILRRRVRILLDGGSKNHLVLLSFPK